MYVCFEKEQLKFIVPLLCLIQQNAIEARTEQSRANQSGAKQRAKVKQQRKSGKTVWASHNWCFRCDVTRVNGIILFDEENRNAPIKWFIASNIATTVFRSIYVITYVLYATYTCRYRKLEVNKLHVSLALSPLLFLGSQNMCVSAILRMFKCQRLCKLFLSSSVSNISGYDISMEIAIANKRTHNSDRASERASERHICQHTHIWTGAQWNDKRPYTLQTIIPFCLLCINPPFSLCLSWQYERWRKKSVLYVFV